MKNLFITIIVSIFTLGSTETILSQTEKDLDKMLFYYVDGEYERLLDKAIAFTEDEDTRRNPVPYIYVSKAYFEMSKIEEYDEDYPRAYRDAVKYAAKFTKKDKEGEFKAENEEYIDGLKIQTFELADNYYQIANYSKAKRYFKYLVGMDPEDWGAWFLKGVNEVQINMKSDSEISLKNAMDGLSSLEKDEVELYFPGKIMLLKKGILYYAEYLRDNGKTGEAKEVIELGYTFFEDDNEYKINYDDYTR